MIISIVIIYLSTLVGGVILYKKYKFLKDNLNKEHLVSTRDDLNKVHKQYNYILETLKEYKKVYSETRRYVVNATIELEQRPEEVRKELLGKLKDKDREIKIITSRVSHLKESVERENRFLIQSVRKLEDTTVRKSNSNIRY
jgi:GTPase involved in cell partitioning and DNA repair